MRVPVSMVVIGQHFRLVGRSIIYRKIEAEDTKVQGVSGEGKLIRLSPQIPVILLWSYDASRSEGHPSDRSSRSA